MSKIIKIALGDDMRRKTYQDITFDAFKQDVINTFNLENGSFIIKYQDKIINSDELFLYIINNTQSTIKFDIEKRSFQDLYEDEEIKVKDVPKQNIPENNNNNNNNTNNVSNPKMPNIFSTLFGGNNQQSNPLSMLMGFLPGMMGGNNNNNNNNVGFSGMFPALMQNLPNILKILTENLPKEKLQELIVTILKSIPREQLISVLKTALSSPQVQESIISTLMSSLDKMIESPNESPIPQKENTNQNVIDEKKRIEENEQKKQEETRRRIEELKRQKEEIKKKQEEELLKQQQETSKLEEEKKIEEQKKIDEEIKKKKLEEFLKHQENLKKQYEEQKKQEEKKKEEERLRYEEMMKEQEERKKKIEEEDIKRKQQEEEKKKRLEEEHRIKLLELQEIERKKVEELKLLEQKKLEEENLKKLEEESKRNTFMIKLQSNGIPYECYRNAEEIGLIESYGIEKVTDLLIKHRGNVEMVANELFN